MLASSFYRLLQRLAFGCWVAIVSITPVYAQSDPLPSWNDTAAKQAIVAFVGKVTREGTPDFVPVRGAHRHVRQRRHAVGGAARSISSSCSRSTG